MVARTARFPHLVILEKYEEKTGHIDNIVLYTLCFKKSLKNDMIVTSGTPFIFRFIGLSKEIIKRLTEDQLGYRQPSAASHQRQQE